MISRQGSSLRRFFRKLQSCCWHMLPTTVFILLSATYGFGQGRETQINGESGAWTMMIRDPWMGGSYTQIQDVIKRSTENSPLKRLFQVLAGKATSTDAVVMTMEDGNVRPALLYIDYGDHPFPIDQLLTDEIFRKAGLEIILGKLSPGSTCQFVRREAVNSAGYPAIRGYFDCREPSGVQIKSIFETIGRPSDHVSILLYVDSRVSVQRFRDYASMLQTFRFTK